MAIPARPLIKPIIKPPAPQARITPPASPADSTLTANTVAPASGYQKIALLVPLTGEGSQLGQAMLDAANLAVFALADKNFELLPFDTGATPATAKQAADKAVKAGAQLILGPLYSSSVASVRPVARYASLNVISFSNDAAQAGDNVFVMGFLPSSQIERVVTYAHAHGSSRFASLVPDSVYGREAFNAYQTAVTQSGGSLAGTARYAPNTPDLTAQLQSVAAAGPFDALLLPESGDRLASTVRALPAAGIDPRRVHLLGTGLWDEPAIGQNPALLGGWYAGTAPTARSDFENRFDSTYHYKPPRLATLAYDATALAIVLGRQGTGSQYDITNITNPSGFAGIDGIFRFQPDGLIERGLAVLQVGPTGPTVIDSAPKSFSEKKTG
jgi:ABC-type branched-subunit amino acid transport system substrate-binding protein